MNCLPDQEPLNRSQILQPKCLLSPYRGVVAKHFWRPWQDARKAIQHPSTGHSQGNSTSWQDARKAIQHPVRTLARQFNILQQDPRNSTSWNDYLAIQFIILETTVLEWRPCNINNSIDSIQLHPSNYVNTITSIQLRQYNYIHPTTSTQICPPNYLVMQFLFSGHINHVLCGNMLA